MGLTLQNLRDRLRKATGTDEDDLTNTDADLYLNMSWWELQDKVNFREREYIAEFTLPSGTRSTTISDDVTDFNYVRSVTLRTEDGDDYGEVMKKEYQDLQIRQSNADSAEGTPEIYARFNTDIYFWPVPEQDYIVQLQVQKTLADIGTDGPPIPQVWHEFIFLGAVYRFFMDLGEHRRASAFRNQQEAVSITTQDDATKERSDNHYSGMIPLKRSYP